MKKNEKRKSEIWKVFLVGLLVVIFSFNFVFSAPVPADQVDYGTNETKAAASSLAVNVSGGYISNFNLTATVQNLRWKAFVGRVLGTFTLDDSSGSTIYDWSYASSTGRVYATRNDSNIDWVNINCAPVSAIEAENIALGLTSSDDNITSTFDDTTHAEFDVGAKTITPNNCSTLNTYRENATGYTNKSQDSSSPFEEMVLYDGSRLVFATIVENAETSYNNETADFQMIVPENASAGATGNILYYMYMELGS